MFAVRRLRAGSIAALLLSFVACHDPTGPSVKPAGIRLVSGDAQSAAAGSALADAPRFVVYDSAGRSLAGARVSVSVTAGGGTLKGTPSRSADGPTPVGTWTLGPHVGANALSVSVPGVAPLVISATGVAGSAARLVALTPTAVSGRVGETLAGPLSARVTDSFENAIAGAVVSVSASGGSAPASVTADANGVVAIDGWTLPTATGQSALTLRSGSASLSFVASVAPGDPVRLVRADSTIPSAMAGATVAPIRLRLLDKFGNPVPSTPVDLAVTAGGGSLAASIAASDFDGFVVLSGWTLGRTALPQIVHASTATLAADVAAAVRTSYHIEVRFFGPEMTDAQKALFSNAAARIEAVIVGAIPDVDYAGLDVSSECGMSGLPVLNETVHGLVLFASVQSIDGPGHILAESGPCTLRDGSQLPSVGVMLFDQDDLASMSSQGILQDVITHEMLHTVGFGTIWQQKGVLIAAGTVNSSFTGSQARQGCVGDGGQNACASFVPVENDGIPGTADGHWRESVFGSELMTGFVNLGGMPLSAITVGSLADLGYVVNPLAADPYVVPATPRGNRIPAPAGPWERRIGPAHTPAPPGPAASRSPGP